MPILIRGIGHTAGLSECKQRQAHQAAVCPKCKTVYFGRDVPGETGLCPKCSNESAAGVARKAIVPRMNRLRVNENAGENQTGGKGSLGMPAGNKPNG